MQGLLRRVVFPTRTWLLKSWRFRAWTTKRNVKFEKWKRTELAARNCSTTHHARAPSICRVPLRLVFDSAILFLNSFSENFCPICPHSLETDLLCGINVVGGGGVFNPYAASYWLSSAQTIFETHDRQKRRQYEERIWEVPASRHWSSPALEQRDGSPMHSWSGSRGFCRTKEMPRTRNTMAWLRCRLAGLCLATCQRPLPPRDKRKRTTGGDNIVRNRRLGRGTGQLAASTLRSRAHDKQNNIEDFYHIHLTLC